MANRIVEITEPLGHSATAPTSTCPKTQTCVAPTVGVGVGVRVDDCVFVTAAVDVAVAGGVLDAVTVAVDVADGVCALDGVTDEVGVVDTAVSFTHSVPGSFALPVQSISRSRT